MSLLDEELLELRNELKQPRPKAHKEGLLRQIRELERILGYESEPYNCTQK